MRRREQFAIAAPHHDEAANHCVTSLKASEEPAGALASPRPASSGYFEWSSEAKPSPHSGWAGTAVQPPLASSPRSLRGASAPGACSGDCPTTRGLPPGCVPAASPRGPPSAVSQASARCSSCRRAVRVNECTISCESSKKIFSDGYRKFKQVRGGRWRPQTPVQSWRGEESETR